jgi:S1-C subfamily serine protease
MAQSLACRVRVARFVNKITPASAAEAAGIHVGVTPPVVQRQGSDHLSDFAAAGRHQQAKPGSRVEVKLFRDGKTLSAP